MSVSSLHLAAMMNDQHTRLASFDQPITGHDKGIHISGLVGFPRRMCGSGYRLQVRATGVVPIAAIHRLEVARIDQGQAAWQDDLEGRLESVQVFIHPGTRPGPCLAPSAAR